MPQFDNRKAAQVWQRVHAAPEAPQQEAGRILALIPDLQSCTLACASHKELSAAFHKQTAALRGIYALLSGEPSSSVGRPPVGRRNPAHSGSSLSSATLRKCYASQLNALSEYQALCAGAEFGPALQALIPLAQSTCLDILALLGS